ncbi:hypothetical protein F4810DRAFT_708485 [Camillea tinctor]|nr:hypothetical protein F4810DRAFT_708485 [Camillea tinctor]
MPTRRCHRFITSSQKTLTPQELLFGGYRQDDESRPSRPKIAPRRSKIKTRGTPGPQAALAPELQEAEAEPLPLIKVSSRTLDVLDLLFYNPELGGGRAGRGGFATTSGSGSAFTFTPPQERGHDDDNDGQYNAKWFVSGEAISFHEPHPETKISFWRARKWGKRLRNQYGWTGKMFTPPKEQETAGNDAEQYNAEWSVCKTAIGSLASLKEIDTNNNGSHLHAPGLYGDIPETTQYSHGGGEPPQPSQTPTRDKRFTRVVAQRFLCLSRVQSINGWAMAVPKPGLPELIKG